MMPRLIPTPIDLVEYIADDVADALGDPAAQDREIARVRGVVGTVDVLDATGRAIVRTSAADAQPCWTGLPADRARAVTRDSYCAARRRALPSGEIRYAIVRFPALPPKWQGNALIVLPLIVITIASLLLSRSLSRPLRRISAVARALGDGKLDARVELRRHDELGVVARAVDAMADRIVELLRGERELMANISHELRSPLARIRVALDLAAEGDAAAVRESLADIVDDIAELERLIGDVLTMARLDLSESWTAAAAPPMRWEPVDLRQIVGRAAARFETLHPDRPLHVRLVDDVIVDGHPALLRRALDNLLENAHKFTEARDQPVTIEVDTDDGPRIRVVDHGVGIAPEDIPHVFRPFFRADPSRTRSTGGLGLGLAIVRRIVHAHGGTVRLESVVGQGTVVTVELPTRRREGSPLPSQR
jgi:signal transduction histidine kinase